VFPLISFIIFFSFFVGLIIYVMRIKKSSIEEISALPLQDSEPIKTRGHENE